MNRFAAFAHKPMKALFSLILVSLALVSSASAEFICRANVSYSWAKDKEMSKIMVFVGALESTGNDEASAKKSLMERLESEKVRASEQCTKNHENQAGCIASKFASLSSTMQALPFSSRKLIEESIASDCKAQQGKCNESVASEPQCVEKAGATPAEEKKEAGKEGGKDAKKKK